MKKIGIILVLLFPVSLSLGAQALPPQESLIPEEYDPNEFPLWAHDLRRFEVIFFGSLPVTYVITSLFYDTALFASNNFNPNYGLGTQRSSEDITILMLTSLSVSGVIALADFIVGKVKAGKAESVPYE